MKFKKHFRVLAALLMAMLLFLSSVGAYAHSGRTDSRGGRKDNKNKSGLGSYHYHCGGHPAHLHKNGCPYSSNSSSSKSSPTKKPTTTQKPLPTATPVPMKYVDGVEIPAYDFPVAKGQKHASVEDIQRALTDMGYLNDIIDGIYGNKTEAAIISYCNAYNAEIEKSNTTLIFLYRLEYDGHIDENLYVHIMKDYWEYLETLTIAE